VKLLFGGTWKVAGNRYYCYKHLVEWSKNGNLLIDVIKIHYYLYYEDPESKFWVLCRWAGAWAPFCTRIRRVGWHVLTTSKTKTWAKLKLNSVALVRERTIPTELRDKISYTESVYRSLYKNWMKLQKWLWTEWVSPHRVLATVMWPCISRGVMGTVCAGFHRILANMSPGYWEFLVLGLLEC